MQCCDKIKSIKDCRIEHVLTSLLDCSGEQDVEKKAKTLLEVLDRYSETASLGGIPHIKRASRWHSKLFWIIVTVAATCAWVWHSTTIINSYIAYDTTTTVTIKYENAPYPSFTFCNINPARQSAIIASTTPQMADLKDFVQDISPRLHYVHETYEDYTSVAPTNNTTTNSTTPQHISNITGTTTKYTTQSTLVNITDSASIQTTRGDKPTTVYPPPQTTSSSTNISQPPLNSNPGRRKLLQSPLYDYIYQNYVDQPDFYAGNGLVEWDEIANISEDYSVILSDPQASSYSRTLFAFNEMIADVPDTDRIKFGNQLTDMLLYCSYDSIRCNARNFSRYLDIHYGNCWTFNTAEISNKSLLSKHSGSRYGLDLVIFIDDAEYIEGLQLGRGIRIQTHAFKSMPFVADNGISVAPGQQAFIAMRLTNQTKIGGVYGACDDNGDFEKYYNYEFIYTLEACERTCVDRLVSQMCQCFRVTQRQYYNINDLTTLKKCSSPTDIQCVERVKAGLDNGSLSCGCNQACRTLDYQSIPSYDYWPDNSLWHSLIDAVCVREPGDCGDFKNISYHERTTVLRNNFIHLKVYFQELNVQHITENVAYEAGQFASDFGGAIGLWIGATAITVIELFDLSCQLCLFCRRIPKVVNAIRRKSNDDVIEKDSFNDLTTKNNSNKTDRPISLFALAQSHNKNNNSIV